jgi:hypothetical protein
MCCYELCELIDLSFMLYGRGERIGHAARRGTGGQACWMVSSQPGQSVLTDISVRLFDWGKLGFQKRLQPIDRFNRRFRLRFIRFGVRFQPRFVWCSISYGHTYVSSLAWGWPPRSGERLAAPPPAARPVCLVIHRAGRRGRHARHARPRCHACRSPRAATPPSSPLVRTPRSPLVLICADGSRFVTREKNEQERDEDKVERGGLSLTEWQGVTGVFLLASGCPRDGPSWARPAAVRLWG